MELIKFKNNSLINPALFLKLTTLFVLLVFYNSKAKASEKECDNTSLYYSKILEEVSKKNKDVIKQLPECFKNDRNLMMKVIMIDYSQFQNASEALQEDENFVKRLLKITPEVLKYVAPELRSNPFFMENATYINRDALQYASWNLLDNKLFMKKMIQIDSRNYKYASDRIKDIAEYAQIAFEDNGLLLEYATPKIKSDKKIVSIAVKSNSLALEFANKQLKEDADLKNLSKTKSSVISKQELEEFLFKNYLVESNKKNLGKVFGNQGKFFSGNKIINRNYVVKWQKFNDIENIKYGINEEKWSAIAVDEKNYQSNWHKDFKNFPDLIKKIEAFFLRHKIAPNTIENLQTNFLWKVKNSPLTIAFNLYLLNENTDDILGSEFSNITSLTAIAQKHNKQDNKQLGDNWKLTVIEVVFNNEIKLSPAYENGHQKYNLWDLYKTNSEDNNPKIIFKVSDYLSDFFEIYEEQNGGKYQMIHRSKNFPDL